MTTYEQEETQRKQKLNKFKRALISFKNSLQAELNKGIIYENFGQTEVRKLKDMINPYDYDCMKRQDIMQLINGFSEWCMTATPTFK